MQRGRFPLALALASVGSQAVWADLTVRYQFEMKVGPAFPAAVADTVKQQVAGMLASNIETRVKGGKCSSSLGPLKAMIDTGRGEITLFDPASKLFATVPEATYMDRVLAQQQVSGASQQALEVLLRTMKIQAQSRKTGQTALIQGIGAEENLILLRIQTGPSLDVRVEIHQWLATAGELVRVPALNEIANCSSGFGSSSDPSGIIEKILGPMAGANGLSDAMKDLATIKGRVTLKIEVDVFAPALAAIMQAQGRGAAAAADANAPLIDVSFNIVELSPDPLPDAMFQVPEGYQPAPLEDLLKTLTKPGSAQPQPKAAQAPVAAARVIEDFKGIAYPAGGGVSNPVPVYHPEPQYTAEDRGAKVEGSALLSLIVDENGAARNVRVVRSLDPGLDQSAIDMVRKWTFTPGEKDGGAVAVAAQIEVTFRLI